MVQLRDQLHLTVLQLLNHIINNAA
jgi:hypothetical protein